MINQKEILSAFLVCMCLPYLTNGIIWNDNWANACDFDSYHDMENVPTQDFECGGVCASTVRCTHFSWKGGNCQMKWGRGSKDDAFDNWDESTCCGFIEGSVNWNGNDWANNCDFATSEISTAQVSADRCGAKCSDTSGCSHYTWSDFEGGTCWMKGGQVSKDDAFFANDQTMVCGVVSGGGEGDAMVSQEQFNAALMGCGYPTPSYEQYTAFIGGISQSGITTVRELAMFLANIIHESAGLTELREIHCQETGCVGEYLPPGPNGVVYYGRGYIQLTWDFNYRPASQYLYNDENVLLNDPDIVAREQFAAWGSAFWYWNAFVHNAPGVAEGNFGATTNAINGPLECSGGWNPQAYKRFEYYTIVLPSFGSFETPIESGCYN